jgi:transposase
MRRSTGKGATAMIEALIDGERRGGVLADLAIGRMRSAGKLADLSMALAGRFTGHHALLCRLHLDRIKVFDDAVEGLDGRIAAGAARWQREAGLLKSVPGFGDVVAWAWLAEIGPAPHQWFSRHEKLASRGPSFRVSSSPPRCTRCPRLARRRRRTRGR